MKKLAILGIIIFLTSCNTNEPVECVEEITFGEVITYEPEDN